MQTHVYRYRCKWLSTYACVSLMMSFVCVHVGLPVDACMCKHTFTANDVA